MATGCESRRWGTLADLRPGRGHGDQWDWLCRQHERRVLVLPDDCLSLSKSEPVIRRCGNQICSVLFVRNVAWKTGRNHWGLSFFRDRSSISIAGPGIVLLRVYCEPRKLFLVLSPAAHFTSFPFLFFFFSFSLYSSVAQTLKKVGPLDCKLRRGLLRRVGDSLSPLAARFRRGVHALDIFSAKSSNFCVAFLVVAFFLFFFFIYFLSLFLSFSLWWLQANFFCG